MYKRYYDGYARPNIPKDRGEIIVPESLSAPIEEIKPEITSVSEEISVSGQCNKNPIFSLPCDLDDIILIGILVFLLFDRDKQGDDDNDIFMLLIIGFIVFADIL